MSRIAYVGASAVLLLTLVGCVSYTRNVYQTSCERQGVTLGTPAMTSCIDNYIAAGKAQALGDIQDAVSAAIIVTGNVNSQPMSAKTSKQAPLLSDSVSGWQRICQYQTDVQIVQMVINISTSCPKSYQY